MCLSGSLSKQSNCNLAHRFVGRGHDPADPVPIFDRYVEWKYFQKNNEKMLRKSASNPIFPTWQVLLPDRRGHDPALRKHPAKLQFGCLLSETDPHNKECYCAMAAMKASGLALSQSCISETATGAVITAPFHCSATSPGQLPRTYQLSFSLLSAAWGWP